MNSRLGIRITGILLIFAGLIGLLVGFVLFQIFQRQPHLSTTGTAIGLATLLAVVSGDLFVLSCGVGILRRSKWARVSGALIGILATVLSVSTLVATASSWETAQLRNQSHNLKVLLITLGVINFPILVSGLWLVFYLNKRRVLSAFGEPEPTPAGGVSFRADRLPQRMRVSRYIVILCGIMYLAFSAIDAYLGFSGKAFAYLGVALHGNCAFVAFLFFALSYSVVGLGLLFRVSVTAHYTSLLLQLLGTIEMTLWAFPSYRFWEHRALATAHSQTARILSNKTVFIMRYLKTESFTVFAFATLVFSMALFKELTVLRELRRSEAGASMHETNK